MRVLRPPRRADFQDCRITDIHPLALATLRPGDLEIGDTAR